MPCQQPRSVPGGCASCPLSGDNSVQACTLMGLSRVLASRPQPPYALLGGLEILVDRNPALRCRLYPRFLWMKNVCYRSSSTGDHDLLCGDRHSLSGLPVQSNELLEARRCPFHLFHFMVGDDVDVPAQHFLCKFRDLRLFVRDKSGVPSYDRDLGPHTCEEVAEFCRDVSASHDSDALRQLFHFEG